MADKSKLEASKQEKVIPNDKDNTLDNDQKLYRADISSPKWVNNNGEEVKAVFGFNENAELVNARAAMFGFAMLLLTEIAFGGLPVTHSIFGIG